MQFFKKYEKVEQRHGLISQRLVYSTEEQLWAAKFTVG